MDTYLNFLFFKKKHVVPKVISLGNLTTISPALRPSKRKHQNLQATSGMPSHLHIYATLCVNGNRCFSANYAQFFSSFFLSFFFFFEKYIYFFKK
jgi:hypothetical protein